MANLPYTILKHQEEAPQLPSGYPGMIMLALVPPLWFKLMNQKVNAWSKN
jgi:alkane 1-monooxygenase